MLPVLLALWKANYSVYGARKLWKAARRAGHDIGPDQVGRLMRKLGIRAIAGTLAGQRQRQGEAASGLAWPFPLVTATTTVPGAVAVSGKRPAHRTWHRSLPCSRVSR